MHIPRSRNTLQVTTIPYTPRHEIKRHKNVFEVSPRPDKKDIFITRMENSILNHRILSSL